MSSTDVQNMINTSIAPLQTAITNLQNALSIVQTAISTIQTAVTGIQTSLTGIQTNLTTVQNTVTSSSARITATEATLASDEAKLSSQAGILTTHDTRISNLESNIVNDFTLPASWVATMSGTTISVKGTKNVISLSCTWNGLVLGQQVLMRGIAHLPSKDYFASGNCDAGLSFTGITDVLSSGSTVSVDLWAFWEGKTKTAQVSVIVP